jgi:hypothetical protein
MYEVDFTGWTRTPEELERIKSSKTYRLKLNWIRFYKAIKYRRLDWYIFWNLILNRNNF